MADEVRRAQPSFPLVKSTNVDGDVMTKRGTGYDLETPAAGAIDTDSTFAANSDTVVPSQKAVKTALAAKTITSEIRAVTVAFAATVTPNADTTDVLNIGALTGNITIANPTGTPVDGQNLRLRLAQDGTGSRTLTWGNAFAFGTDVTAALIPSAASAKWEMLFTWDAADSKWRAAAIIRGF